MDFRFQKDVFPFKVDSHKLLSRIALLKDQIMISKFVGPKPNSQALEMWLQTMNQELKRKFLNFLP